MTRCYLAGLLIDHTYQGRGYGTAVVSHVLDVVPRTYPACEAIGLTVHPKNMVATRLYQRFGFSKTGVVIDGEDAMWLTLPHHALERCGPSDSEVEVPGDYDGNPTGS